MFNSIQATCGLLTCCVLVEMALSSSAGIRQSKVTLSATTEKLKQERRPTLLSSSSNKKSEVTSQKMKQERRPTLPSSSSNKTSEVASEKMKQEKRPTLLSSSSNKTFEDQSERLAELRRDDWSRLGSGVLQLMQAAQTMFVESGTRASGTREWGSKDQFEVLAEPARENALSRYVGSDAVQRHHLIAFSKVTTTSMTFLVAIFVVAALASIACLWFFIQNENSQEGESKGFKAAAAPPPPECFRPKTYQDLHAILDCDGSWVMNYNAAEGRQKQALELLFRCSIIPTEEFAHSRVSQDHMDECIWIATHMLKQKPLEEWVYLCSEACQAFQASVTACFSARTDVRTLTNNLDRSQMMSYNMPGGDTPPGARPPPTGPSAASTLLDLSATPPPDHPDILSSTNDNGENLLVLRCREIMASHSSAGTAMGSGSFRHQEMLESCAAADVGPLDSVSQPADSARWDMEPPPPDDFVEKAYSAGQGSPPPVPAPTPRTAQNLRLSDAPISETPDPRRDGRTVDSGQMTPGWPP